MTSTYYGSAEWLADVAREHEEECEAGRIERAKEDARRERDYRAHLKAGAEAGLVVVRAPYSGRVVSRYRERPQVTGNDVGALERFYSTGGL